MTWIRRATWWVQKLGSVYPWPRVFRIISPCQNRLYSSAFVGTSFPTAADKDSRVPWQIERISGCVDLESNRRPLSTLFFESKEEQKVLYLKSLSKV